MGGGSGGGGGDEGGAAKSTRRDTTYDGGVTLFANDADITQWRKQWRGIGQFCPRTYHHETQDHLVERWEDGEALTLCS